MSAYLYGCSDDLIELEGDLYDTFYYGDGWTDIMFDNGVHAQIQYGDGGEWNIRVLETNGNVVLHYLVGADEAKSRCSYSELLVVEGDIKWAIVGKKVNKR